MAGPIADKFGVQLWFGVAGVVCAFMGVLGFFLPNVMNMVIQKQADLVEVTTNT